MMPAFSRLFYLFFCFLLASSLGRAQDNINLPDLGGSVSGVASLEQEYTLGRAWLRLYRNKVPELNDPLLFDYINVLLNQLADNSLLEDKRLQLVLVRNPTMNAFAVPGGVVGIHSGLLTYTNTEQELAGVMAHELAHVSQRHWVRSVQKAEAARIPTMAGLLGGLILMGSGVGGDAGLAAIMATQAANLEYMLRFSREQEAEADRIGMQTLVRTGMDPHAVPDMFSNMQRSMRFMGDRPPEFLLSHPVTEKRIADSMLRADQYPTKKYDENPGFQLMRARARLAVAENPSTAAKHFQSELQNQDKYPPEASRYGLALAQIAMKKFTDADKTLAPLYAQSPNSLPYILARADILTGLGQAGQADTLLATSLQRHPRNYPIIMSYAKVLNTENQYDKAVKQLERLLPQYAAEPPVWYMLAETRGLAGDVPGVHMARAEYFILNGRLDDARKQLTYAVKLYSNDYVNSAKAKQRLRDVQELENQMLDI